MRNWRVTAHRPLEQAPAFANVHLVLTCLTVSILGSCSCCAVAQLCLLVRFGHGSSCVNIPCFVPFAFRV